MAIRFMDFGNQISALIRRRSRKSIEQHSEVLGAQMIAAARDWQIAIRAALGVISPRSHIPNTTAWPKKRTGALQRSILRPEIRWTERTSAFRKKRGNVTLEFIASSFYGPIADTGYGDTLHTGVASFARSTTFNGWKHRANSIMFMMLRLAAKV